LEVACLENRLRNNESNDSRDFEPALGFLVWRELLATLMRPTLAMRGLGLGDLPFAVRRTGFLNLLF
jgi:hypothetical protein